MLSRQMQQMRIAKLKKKRIEHRTRLRSSLREWPGTHQPPLAALGPGMEQVGQATSILPNVTECTCDHFDFFYYFDLPNLCNLPSQQEDLFRSLEDIFCGILPVHLKDFPQY